MFREWVIIMRIRYLAVALAITFLMHLTPSASASISQYNDPGLATTDGNNITVDSDTGLEWLDWTATTNNSYEEIFSRLEPGGNLEGFQYATLGEVSALFTNMGLFGNLSSLDIHFPNTTSLNDGGVSATSALGYLGNTAYYNGFEESYAVIGESINAGHHRYATVSNYGGESKSEVVNNQADVNSNLQVGHALVRASSTGSVPEPSSVLCWGGLVLAFANLRKRRKTA